MTADSRPAVFLSYAREDSDAARRITEALRAAGVVVWFDQSELRGGDAWDAKIRKQIKECTLFVPLISGNTQSRPEGYFRLEWKLAVDRSHLIADDQPFLVPVVIDDTTEAAARVPDRFRDVQWVRLSLKETPESLATRVAGLLTKSEPDAARHDDVIPSRTPRRERRPRGLRYVWMAFGMVLALIYAVRPMFMSKDGHGGATRAAESAASATNGPTAQTTSEARRLVDHARTIVSQPSLTRAQLDSAAELCERALKLDTTDPIVWAVAARTDLFYVFPYGYDRSDERRRQAQERAARAASLAPDDLEVRVTQAAVFAHAVGTPAFLAESEKTMRELVASHPGQKSLVQELAEVLREEKKFEEAARLFESIGDYEVAGWSYYLGDKLRPGLAAVARAQRTGTAIQLTASLQLAADEDLDEAQATLDRLRPDELANEMSCAIAMKVAAYRRDSARILELAQGLPQEYLDSHAFRGPRRFYTGLAHEIAGRPAQAEVEWRAALAVVETKLKTTPDDVVLLRWAAFFHASLHETAEAERIFARSQTLAGLSGDTLDTGNNGNTLVLLRLRRQEALFKGSVQVFRDRQTGWEATHADMRYHPLADFLRADPAYMKLLRENLPPGAKPIP